MARARNGVNQRGTYGRKPVGPIGKRPTPRTGGGMKLPKKMDLLEQRSRALEMKGLKQAGFANLKAFEKAMQAASPAERKKMSNNLNTIMSGLMKQFRIDNKDLIAKRNAADVKRRVAELARAKKMATPLVAGKTGGGMKVPTKKRPMPKTGGGMKVPTKKIPKPKTGGGMKLPTKTVMGGSTGGGMKVPTKKRPTPKTGGGMKLAKKKYTSVPKATPVNPANLPPALKKARAEAMAKLKAEAMAKLRPSNKRGEKVKVPTTNTRNPNFRGNMPNRKIGGSGPKMFAAYMNRKRSRRR